MENFRKNNIFTLFIQRCMIFCEISFFWFDKVPWCQAQEGSQQVPRQRPLRRCATNFSMSKKCQFAFETNFLKNFKFIKINAKIFHIFCFSWNVQGPGSTFSKGEIACLNNLPIATGTYFKRNVWHGNLTDNKFENLMEKQNIWCFSTKICNVKVVGDTLNAIAAAIADCLQNEQNIIIDCWIKLYQKPTSKP